MRKVVTIRLPGAVQLVPFGPELLTHVVVLVASHLLVVATRLEQGLFDHDGVIDVVHVALGLRPKRFSRGPERMAHDPSHQPGLQARVEWLGDDAPARPHGVMLAKRLEAFSNIIALIDRMGAEDANVFPARFS